MLIYAYETFKIDWKYFLFNFPAKNVNLKIEEKTRKCKEFDS